MTVNRFSFEKMKTIDDSMIICIALVNITMASCKMSRDKTEIRVVVVKPYCYRALVTRDST